MDNREFDHLFSSQLKTTQSYEFDAADWDGLADRLDQFESRKQKGWGHLWTLLLLLFLLGIVVCQGFHLNQAYTQIDQLEQRFVIGQQTAFPVATTQNSMVLVDTIIRYDTIVQTVYINELIDEKANSHNNNLDEASLQKNTEYPNNSKRVAELLNIQKEKKNTEKKNFDVAQTEKDLKSIGPISLNSLDFQLNEISRKFRPTLDWEELPKVKVRKARSWLSKDRFSLAPFAEWSFPGMYTSEEDAVYSNSVVQKKGWQFGVQLSYLLHRQLSLDLGFSTQTIQYQASGPDSLWGVPKINSLPDESFTYELVDLQQESFNFRLGLNYRFSGGAFWQPYLGMAIEGRAQLRQEVTINYLLVDSLIYEDPNGTTKESFRDSAVRLQTFSPSLGVHFNLSKHLSWQLEGLARIKLKTLNDQMISPFGLRAYLRYQF